MKNRHNHDNPRDIIHSTTLCILIRTNPPSAFGRACFSDVTELFRHCQLMRSDDITHPVSSHSRHPVLSRLAIPVFSRLQTANKSWRHSICIDFTHSESPVNQLATHAYYYTLRSIDLVLWAVSVSDLLLLPAIRNTALYACLCTPCSTQTRASSVGISGLL